MINKQNLWFLTLFSLILVLSVYYITMPNDLLLTNKDSTIKTDNVSNLLDDNIKVSINESELLVTMRVNLEEERNEQVADLKSTLTSEDVTADEKNIAYEQIKLINNLTAKEQQLESKVKKEYDIDCFVKINNNEVKVVAVKENHDISLANNIMKTIQEEFSNKMSISVQFEK